MGNLEKWFSQSLPCPPRETWGEPPDPTHPPHHTQWAQLDSFILRAWDSVSMYERREG